MNAGDSDNGGQWGAPGKVRKLRGFELPRGWVQIDNGPKADDPFGPNTEYRKDTHDIFIPGGYYTPIESDDFITSGVGEKGKDFVRTDVTKKEDTIVGKSSVTELSIKLIDILKELDGGPPLVGSGGTIQGGPTPKQVKKMRKFLDKQDDEEEVDETIEKVDGKYVVYPKKGGKRLGTHPTRKAALKQLAAIEMNK